MRISNSALKRDQREFRLKWLDSVLSQTGECIWGFIPQAERKKKRTVDIFLENKVKIIKTGPGDSSGQEAAWMETGEGRKKAAVLFWAVHP